MADASIDNSPLKRVVLVDSSGSPFYAGTSPSALPASLATSLAGEDLVNDVLKTEQRFSLLKVTADTLVKTGSGFLHALTFSCNDAAPTAGSIIIYDNTAESGTELFNHTFTTTPFVPFTVFLDGVFSIGLYVGFTTTNDVNLTVSYR